MRRSGFWLVSLVLVLAAALRVRYGFSQGGFPSHIRTMAILPFENETSSPEISKELYDEMPPSCRNDSESVTRRKSAPTRSCAEKSARTTRTFPSASAPTRKQALTARRQLQITIDIEIVDQSNGQVLLPAERHERAKASTPNAPKPRVGKAGDQAARQRHRREGAVPMVTIASRRQLAGLSLFAARRCGDRLLRHQHRRSVLALLRVPGHHAAGGALRGAQHRRPDQAPARRRGRFARAPGARRTRLRPSAEPRHHRSRPSYYEHLELPLIVREVHSTRTRVGQLLSVAADPRDKIMNWSRAEAWRSTVRGRVVFTNGVFDLLHPGHVDVLLGARRAGRCPRRRREQRRVGAAPQGPDSAGPLRGRARATCWPRSRIGGRGRPSSSRTRRSSSCARSDPT